MKNEKLDQEYSFALRPASIEEAGLFYSNDEQDEALGTVGHLRLDFGHGFLELRSTGYPHNDEQFDTLEFKMLLREFLAAMQENGPLESLSSMEDYCQKHGGAITEDGQTYGYIWETEQYRFCLRCTPSPFDYQGYLYCYDLRQQKMAQKNCLVGQVTYANGDRQEFTDAGQYLQTIREELPYRDTTGFRFETLTDDPQVRKAVDDILLDFTGEENPRRVCNYGLTDAGRQALEDTADLSKPHTYSWFVMTDCGTPEEQLCQNLTLDEAVQAYGSATSVEPVITSDGGAMENKDVSKNAAIIPPGFGTVSMDTRNTGSYLTPNLAPDSAPAVGAVVNGSGVGISVPENPFLNGQNSGSGASTVTTSTGYTKVTSDLYYSGGYLGTLKIPAIGLSVKVYQGTDSSTLMKGAGHFKDTSIWDGNVCIAGHNRGVRDDFGDLHTLDPGDTITWTTKLGTRTYEVVSVEKVLETDTSGTAATTDNRLTLFTCVRDQRAYRWQVQAVEV